jgi:hypothetical protein
LGPFRRPPIDRSAAGYANAMPPTATGASSGWRTPCDLACATTIEQAILGSDPGLVSA